MSAVDPNLVPVIVIPSGGGGVTLPTTAADDVIDGATPDSFFTTDAAGNGQLSSASSARTLMGAVPTTRTLAGLDLSADRSAAALAAALDGAVTTDFTAGSSGWTLSAGSSGRGSAVQSGAGLTLDLTVGALVAWDVSSGFNAPSATRTLPSGGARGCRAEVAFAPPSNVNNRTGLFFRDAARNYTVGVQYNRSSDLIELLGLSPGISVFGSTTLAGTRALCVEIVGGQIAAYASTTATPGAADWRFVGATSLPGSWSAARARALDTVEIAHPTYAAVASTVVIASATVRAL